MSSWSFWGSLGRFCTSCTDDAGAIGNERHSSPAHRAHLLGAPSRQGLPAEGGVMQVRWSDVGCTEEAGACELQSQIVQVDQRNIDIWKQHPNAVFDVAWIPGSFSIRARWLLTSWS